jgi:hypothetical protein
MRKSLGQFIAAATLALAGPSVQAAIIPVASGTEAIITFVNANNDSIAFDTGDLDLQAGDFYALPTAVVNFIGAAGGAGGVNFGLIRGNSTTRNYVTTSVSDVFETVEVANSFRNPFASAVGQYAQDLNASVPSTPNSANDVYGPFLTGTGSPNYIDAGYDTWQTGNFEFSNLGLGTQDLFLYAIQFALGASQLGFATVTELGGANPLLARLNLAQGRVEIATAGEVVPAPAALWLLGTALFPVARRAFRKPAVAT